MRSWRGSRSHAPEGLVPTSEQLEACLEERSALLARPAGCRHLSAGRPSQLPIGLVSRALDSATSGIVIADARPGTGWPQEAARRQRALQFLGHGASLQVGCPRPRHEPPECPGRFPSACL